MIITISREFGSGGRVVGQKVAEALGFRFYDNELIRAICKENGLDFDFVSEQSEYAKNKFFFHVTQESVFLSPTGGVSMPMQDRIFAQCSKIVKKIAAEENAVIVGRSADAILEGVPDLFNVFIHADEGVKCKRVISLGLAKNEKEALKTMRRRDKMRANFHKYYTGKAWGKAENYAMTMSSSVLGHDFCAETIVAAVKAWKGNAGE